MSQFDNVTVVREANVYFNGNVTSRTVVFANGEKKTLGVMLPGEYRFGTDSPEIMEILSGDLEVTLPCEDKPLTVKGGETFEVSAESVFTVKVKTITDYCCSYL